MQLLWYQNKPHITTISAGCLLSLFVAWCVGRSKVALHTLLCHISADLCHIMLKCAIILVNCLCPTTSYDFVQSHCSISSGGTLQHCLSSNIRALKMATESQDIFPTTAGARKLFSCTSWWACELLWQSVFQALFEPDSCRYYYKYSANYLRWVLTDGY